MKNLLTIKELYKRKQRNHILNNISLDIEYGKIIALIGNNGAGKTSLINLISGLYLPQDGKINFYGMNKKVIFDTPPNLEDITVNEYLNLFYMLYNKSCKSYSSIEEIINLINLREYRNKKVKTLSFGMKKKLYLSTILLGVSDLIILDEPFNGLDFNMIESFKNILKKYQKETNCTFIISSHHLKELSDICNSICIIENGVIVEYIDIDNIEKNIMINNCDVEGLEKLFLKKGIQFTITKKNLVKVYSYECIFDLIKLMVSNQIYFEEIYFEDPLMKGIKI